MSRTRRRRDTPRNVIKGGRSCSCGCGWCKEKMNPADISHSLLEENIFLCQVSRRAPEILDVPLSTDVLDEKKFIAYLPLNLSFRFLNGAHGDNRSRISPDSMSGRQANPGQNRTPKTPSSESRAAIESDACVPLWRQQLEPHNFLVFEFIRLPGSRTTMGFGR